MPYREISDLPDSVKNHLSRHAQEIYLAAFNNAWAEYAGRENHEAVVHKVAWSAVKKQYVKIGNEWVKK